MGLNNAVKTFRPNLWVSVDEPDHFLRSIWLDPAILKFSPLEYASKPIFNSDTWTFMQLTAGDCPNVAFFRRNDQFQAEHFLRQDSINWGNHRRYGGGRSVLLAALRILFILGFRRVFLLGVDFEMNEGYRYHFDQSRAAGSISGNNSTYEKLKRWLAELRPVLERDKFFVFNCNPASRLTAFEHVPVTEAVGMVLREEFDGVDIGAERTQGLYDTSAGDKRSGTSQTPGA